MKKSLLRLIVLLLFLLQLPLSLSALTIKLASPLPEGTEWDNTLRRMADEWSEITGGRVRMRIYPGGIAGDEGDVVRKMRIGQIDAGVFSAYGLKVMVPETFVFTLPGLLQDEEELDYVLDHYVDQFDEKFREEGFEIMAWSKSGWAYIFGQRPIYSPDDLKKETLAVDNSESEISSAFKSLGFNVVPVSINEIMVALQSGLANVFIAPPVGAGAFQWFALAPYITEYRVAPVIGGLVMTERTWSRIPEEFHDKLKTSMRNVAREFYAESVRLNEEAMRVMLENGLKQVPLDVEGINAWESVMMSGHELMVGEGKAIPTEVYDNLLSELEEIRK